MEKLRNDKNLPEQTEEFSHPDDWWLDEEDSADGLPVFDPDEAENYAKDRQRLTGVPMVLWCMYKESMKSVIEK